jgi:inorganic pyrophosphatase
VISERPVDKSEVILDARVVGGLQMVDDDEADDKIIAVLANDNVWGGVENIDKLPKALVDRLIHYFETYKLVPDKPVKVSIEEVYDRAHAEKVIKASIEDYIDEYGG